MTVEVRMLWRRRGCDVSELSRKKPDRILIGTPCERRSFMLMWVQIWAEVIPERNLLHSAAPIRGVATANIEVQIISANVMWRSGPKYHELLWVGCSIAGYMWSLLLCLRYRLQFSQFSSVFHNEWLTGSNILVGCWKAIIGQPPLLFNTLSSFPQISLFFKQAHKWKLLKLRYYLAVRVKHQAKLFTTKPQIHSWTQTAEIREQQRLWGEWTIKAEWRSVLTCVGVWLCASWVKGAWRDTWRF